MTPVAAALDQLSPLALLMGADPVVKGVMGILLAASAISWALGLEILRRQAVLRRILTAAARSGIRTNAFLAAAMEARARDTARIFIPGETGGEYRGRIERALREGAGEVLRRTDTGLSVLATIASTAPFVGLFGTVWGVMSSFSAIAGAQDTSLATVAPGIAEALVPTAMGLFASIPALIAYNRLGARLGALTRMAEMLVRREAEEIAAARPVEKRFVPAAAE